MKQLSKILYIICIAILLCSCNKAKVINVSDNTLTFSIKGGEKSIVVHSDGNYDIIDCPNWVKADVNDSTLTLTLEKNNSGAKKECTINLEGDKVIVPITIIQADKCTHIVSSEQQVTFPKEGGEKILTIKTDGDGIAIQSAAGFKADIKDDKLIINAEANPGGLKTGQLILRCDTVKTIIDVVIGGTICGRCNGSGRITCPNCRGKGGWDCETSDESYAGCEKCGGYGYYWPGYLADSDGRPGSGYITCPDCRGSGKPSGNDNYDKTKSSTINTTQDVQYDWLATRYVTYDDIKNMDKGQVRVLKNAIFARHGRRFKDSNLRAYFNSQSWYTPTCDEVPPNEFNEYENYNIKFLLKYEK